MTLAEVRNAQVYSLGVSAFLAICIGVYMHTDVS